VGTSDVKDKGHFLICFDTKTVAERTRADPIVHFMSFPEVPSTALSSAHQFCTQHIRDVHWIAPELVLCTSGPGHFNLVTVDHDGELGIRSTIKGIHNDRVREVALNQANVLQFASGGSRRHSICALTDCVRRLRSEIVSG